jgi:transposase
MKTTTACLECTVSGSVLNVGIELSEKKWKLAFATSPGQKPRLRDIDAWALKQMQQEVAKTLERFKLPSGTPVYCCYEAGREGFSVHRALEALGWHNLVIDSSSIEVSRRYRRAKADKLDAGKLVNQLARYQYGEKKAFKVVRVPSREEEDRRHWHRELKVLKEDRARISARLRSLLKLQGIGWRGSLRGLKGSLGQRRNWEAQPLPEVLAGYLGREAQRWEDLTEQIEWVDQERRNWMKAHHNPIWQMVVQFMTLKGIGIETAWYLTLELFGWRRFENRRQLGCLAGISPTPYDSGQGHHEQGIGKNSNSQMRAILIEMAWSWIRYQPTSALTLWWKRRFSEAGGRARKIGIVAVARKLLIALWKFQRFGEIPEGANLKRLINA